MDIRAVDVIFLHGPNRPERRAHMESMLQKAGLTGECHIGICGSAVLGLIELFKKRMEGEFKPFIYLEDDCNTTDWFRHIINVPNDADCVYLGISKWSMHPSVNKAVIGIQADYVETNSEVVRLVNMLSNHAILFLSRKWTESCLAAYETTATWESPDYDILQSRNMKSYNVYALKEPLFYQCASVGGHEEATLFKIE